ncbi:PAS domain-containing protein [Azohydromonas sediminis]|uniref:PAS domain-containing protein n=1 Tax=Azohydromonas sediminis TaxID=2259674 RepID=UPI000E656F46|nr:PAS domain-containing protein [Azohydromonas sediminis]
MTAPDASTSPWRDAIDAWLTLPDCAVALLDAQARVQWLSPGAAALAGVEADAARGRPLPDLFGWSQPRALLDALAGDGRLDAAVFETADGRGGAHAYRVHLRPLAGAGERRFVASLADVSEQRQLAARLDLVQEFGRIGTWERDVRTLEGRWDRHMFRFWDMEPTEGTPNFAAAIARVPPEDRLDETFRASLQRAGTYHARFRVRRADGGVRRLHSQWRVIDGADGRPERVVGVMMDDTEAFELARSVESTQQQLRLALDVARIGVWRHDLRTDRAYYDARAFQILGLPMRPDGIDLAEVRSWIHPDDLPAVIASSKRTYATGEPSDEQARFLHADGRWRYLFMRRVLERDAAGQPVAFVGVALDMTEQVERTARSLELAARLEAAARAARVGIWSTTVTTDETDWNAQMYELFDMVGEPRPPSLAEWVGRCVHPDDREQVLARAKAYLKAGDEPLEVELRTLRRDGSTRWIVLRADVDRQRTDCRRLFGVALDVTEQHEAMQALRRANQRAELITRGVGIGTWEVDLDTGEATWDAQMFALRGLPPGARALGEAERLALVHPDDLPRVQGLYARADVAQLPTQVEFRVRWPDGSWHWLASRSVLVPAAEGRGARRIGINWDVTEVKTAEAALREKLIAQRESEAKSRFLARMSHELRTPLNAVLGFTQLLIHDAGRGDVASQLGRLRHIESAGRHLLSLINDVLDLSRVDSGELRLEPGAVVLERLVVETLPLVEQAARARDVKIELGALAARVHADATRLRQILVNLLSNAIKYNRTGGWVRVEAAVTGDVSRRRVRITVADSGRGLTAAQRRHLFEPFNRLGAEREGIEGTGIGLAIVKALVERMDGRIDVASEPGVGSRFEVELPAATADEPETVPVPLFDDTPTTTALAGARRKRLLYIEDNPVNLMIVQELIARRPDLRLDSAADGEGGVRAAQVQHPDLILIDMQLPDFDGHEVLRRLRADPRTADIPCIALSANAMPQDIERALAAGFADYWTKPLDFRAFMKSLDLLFGPATPD